MIHRLPVADKLTTSVEPHNCGTTSTIRLKSTRSNRRTSPRCFTTELPQLGKPHCAKRKIGLPAESPISRFFAPTQTTLTGEHAVRVVRVRPARDAIHLLRGNLSRGRGRGLLLSRGSSGITTAATTTIATTIAAAVATAMATATVMTTTAAAVATAVSAVATIAAAAAAAVMTEGHRLVVTAQQSDADDREKHRETQNNDTIHSQILQKYLQVPVSQNY